MKYLKINEIFFSIQGESLNTGIPTVFVRLTGCPLRCNYCDTKYAFKEGVKMSLSNIIKKIKSYDSRFITITGGEPLAQHNVYSLIDLLLDKSFTVSIETSNGLSIEKINKHVDIVLDIKTPGSGECEKNIIDNYQFLKKTDQVKFVICDINDYLWTKDYIYTYNLHQICNVFLSPSYDEMPIRFLADNILKDKLPARLQTQLHKIIWDNERGK